MEWVLLSLIGVVLGIIIFVGAIAGFFGLFSSNDKEKKLFQLKQETERLSKDIVQINAQMELLKSQLNSLPEAKPLAAALKVVSPSMVIEPKAPVHLNEALPEGVISEAALEKQVHASATPAMAQPAVNMTAKTIEKPATKPYTPPAPNFIERGFASAKAWLFGGNTMVRAGIVILFIGVSFLLKLAIDKGMIPIELRLLAIAIGGIALLVVGWRLRDTRSQYAWTLQGGGVGMLYLTIFAAMKIYGLIPAGAAFALLAAIAFLSAFISVKQSALPLAILGFAGGFLAPILTSTGSGNHIGLFSYYLILNLGIAYIALHKSWRSLNVLGFAFTFIIGSIWGAKSYTPALFSTTEPFLIIHFLLFTAIAVLYAHRQSSKVTDYVDATLVFGTPLVGFSLQYALLKGTSFGLAYSALALGIFYLSLTWWVFNHQRETLKFLGECFLALGIGFVTLTLPLALDGRWTSAAWAVEGVGLLWVGLRQNRNFPALAGLALQVLAALAFVNGWGLTGHSGFGHQNIYLGVGFIALSGWACGALLNKYRPNKFELFSTPLAFWGWTWWVGSGLTAIDALLPSHNYAHAGLIFVSLTSLLLPVVAKKIGWRRLSSLTALLLPAMAIAMLWEIVNSLFTSRYSIFEYYGFIAWPLAFATYAWLVSNDTVPNKTWLRAPLLWLLAVLGVLEWQHRFWQYVGESHVWSDIGWGVIPMLIVGTVAYWQFTKNKPIQIESARTWAWASSLPLMVFVVLWFILMSLNSSGNAAPLRYIPLLNPLDIALAGALLLLIIWQRALSKHLAKLQHINPVLAAVMAFTLLNGMLLRTLHHWVGTPHLWVSIFNNSTVQMAFTFLWAFTAFALMLLAHKKLNRTLWLIGAGLIGLVVAKLFLLDLGQHGSMNRAISFIGAAIMLLVIGYFVPIPPAKNESMHSIKKEV